MAGCRHHDRRPCYNGLIGGLMTLYMIYSLAVLIGVLVTIVPIMNGKNTQVLGTIRVSFFHYFAASITGIVVLFMTASIGEVNMLPDVPIHYFIGGILGLSVILLMNYYSVRIKALHVAILPFLGQMTMGLALDYFLFDKMNLKTVIGLVIVLFGLYIQSEQKNVVAEM